MIMLHENSLSHGNPLSRKTTAFSMNDADRDFGLCPQWFHMMCTGRKAGTIHRWNGWDSWTMLEKSAATFLAACRYMSCWSRIFWFKNIYRSHLFDPVVKTAQSTTAFPQERILKRFPWSYSPRIGRRERHRSFNFVEFHGFSAQGSRCLNGPLELRVLGD